MGWNKMNSILVYKLDGKSSSINNHACSQLRDTHMNDLDSFFFCEILLVESIQKPQCEMRSVSMGSPWKFVDGCQIVHEVKTWTSLLVITSHQEIDIVGTFS